MIKVFMQQNQRLVETDLDGFDKKQIVWIDLHNPTPDEEHQVENLLEIDIPTHDEIREIEISNTLYQENGTVYTTATLVTQSETPEPELHPVSFILTGKTLVTLRYAEPKAFTLYRARAKVTADHYSSGAKIMADLLDVVIGRAADGLEKSARLIEDNYKRLFRAKAVAEKKEDLPPIDFQDVLAQIGTTGSLVSKISDGLISVARVASFVAQSHAFRDQPDQVQHIDTILKDVMSLRDYANSLSHKSAFLLDATLGMISIEQNAIIKIFSVGAVIFLPPTLVASIYGMNFHHMPELDWRFGYPLAIGMMLFSAWLPYRFFKRKGWL